MPKKAANIDCSNEQRAELKGLASNHIMGSGIKAGFCPLLFSQIFIDQKKDLEYLDFWIVSKMISLPVKDNF